MLVSITLTDDEIAAIRAQQKEGGGFQSLFRKLEDNLTDRQLTIDERTATRTIRYCEDYGEGGWQSALQSIAAKLKAAVQGTT